VAHNHLIHAAPRPDRTTLQPVVEQQTALPCELRHRIPMYLLCREHLSKLIGEIGSVSMHATVACTSVDTGEHLISVVLLRLSVVPPETICRERGCLIEGGHATLGSVDYHSSCFAVRTCL
jgi:hypothetical protein